jgi:UTP--glucose-1-phosphate uridylyltransferase
MNVSFHMSEHKKVKKAVFPVAGLGTRFLPATKTLPKEMIPLNDRPLIQHAVEEAKKAGIEDFIFVTGRHKTLLEEHFDYQHELIKNLEEKGKTELLEKVRAAEINDGHLFMTRQQHPLGLGHAVWCAKKLVGNEPFAVILPDDVVLHDQGCLAQMVESYNELGGNLVAVENVPLEETYKYGILDVENEKGSVAEIKAMVEKPDPKDAPSTLSIVGRYILQPEIFNHLADFEKGAGGEIQITDAMAKLIGNQPFHSFRFQGQRFDCGNQLGFIEANLAFALNDKNFGHDVSLMLEKYLEENQGEQKHVNA